jgi:sugar phosphate isomerase/epimerase
LFIPSYLNSTHRYCSNVEEVCDIVDTLGGIAGVCWDFGHVNLIGDDQRECLRAVGKRLKAVHVHDNNGKHDDHAIPFSSSCNVNWAEILPVLGEIGYRGNFNLEVTAGRVPYELRSSLVYYLAQLGRQMMSMIPGQNT